ncbi:hypothetical protein [Pseudactinotalea sp. Z1748]|uniref:deoxynucleotide monophosphate kinase family protein n=1 Tax=Pseudactinotalea sp. Z1748 TaxID=3413027 RepID=UPI003C7D797D
MHTTTPPLIGLHGYAGAGKDTVADILHDIRGYESFAFADNVREALYRLDPLVGAEVTVRSLVDDIGWDRAKWHRLYGPEVRRLMQYMGTDVGRQMFGPQVWVNALAEDLAFEGSLHEGRITHDSLVVVSDVRFDSEAQWVRDHGGVVWHITRPGVGPLNTHSSESGISPDLIDRIIVNDSDLTKLTQDVAKAAGLLGPRAATVAA